MEQPLVSVVTPTYNHERYIGRCIESLLAQTYANWEQVVVDDGSTDNTAKVVRSYKDPRISYVYQENKGVGALAQTINSGVRRTRGQLVTVLASDDMWPPYRLDKQVPVFRDPNVVLCFGQGVLIDDNDKMIGKVTPSKTVATAPNRPIGSALRGLLVRFYIPSYTELISRAALDRIGGYQQPSGLLAEDFPTHLALALQGEFRCLDLPLGYYRMHAGQMTRTHHMEMIGRDLRYAMEFFHRLDPEMQRVTGWTEAGLAKELSRVRGDSCFWVGRRELLAGNKRNARLHFRAALLHGTLRGKAKAIVGLACSVTGLDLERAARLARRPPLR